MPTYALYVADVVAISVLVFVLFLPRHHRPELVVAILTANVGVLAVASALTTATIGAGLGLGLFGILSIIRLRSEELAQSEIAYYFAALTLGLLGGLDQTPTWVDLALMGAVLAAVAIGDNTTHDSTTRNSTAHDSTRSSGGDRRGALSDRRPDAGTSDTCCSAGFARRLSRDRDA